MEKDDYMPEAEIDNTKKIHTLLGVSVVVFIAFIVCLVGGVATRNINKQNVLTFPSSGLSGSIFESQNSSYTANEALPFTHEVMAVANRIDVPSQTKAEVDSGVSYMINETDYAFITEYTEEDNLPTLVAMQLGKAYVMEISLDNCAMQEYLTEEGFLNGNKLVYHCYAAQFANADMTNGTYAYIMGYEYTTADNNRLFMAVSTVSSDNEYLMWLKGTYLDAMAYSYRFDEELDKARAEAAAQEAQEEAEVKAQEMEKAAEEEKEESEENSAQSYYDNWYQSQHETVELVVDGSGTQKLELEVETYKAGTFVFTFTKPTKDFAYHFVDADGNALEVEPDLAVEGENLKASIHISGIKKGTYAVVFDAGGCTYTMPALELTDVETYTAMEYSQVYNANDSSGGNTAEDVNPEEANLDETQK